MSNKFIFPRKRSCKVCIHYQDCSHQKDYEDYFVKVGKIRPEKTDMFHVFVECKDFRWHLESLNKEKT